MASGEVRDCRLKLLNISSPLKILSACRGCYSPNLRDFVHYAQLPVAGTYLNQSELGQEPLFPLTVTFCNDCQLIQLREVLPSEVYTDYRFVGTGSTSYRAHLEWVAEALVAQWGLSQKRVLEIGCNDGYLLKQLREKGKNRVFGYEPSLLLGETCKQSGIPISNNFFSSGTLVECPHLPVDAVIIRHVLEHIDDLDDFVGSIQAALAPGGLLVIEIPDGMSILSKGLYSHFYHEHLSYFSLESLRRLLSPYGFEIVHHKIVDIHGGSLYVVCKLNQENTGVASFQKSEEVTLQMCEDYASGMRDYFKKFHDFFEREIKAGVRLAGYGAAHRTIVTCGLAGLTQKHVSYLVDKNPNLQGFYAPGGHQPIYSPEYLHQDFPDALIIFATSFENEIICEQQRYAEKGGRFISIISEPKYLR